MATETSATCITAYLSLFLHTHTFSNVDWDQYDIHHGLSQSCDTLAHECEGTWTKITDLE